MGKYSPQKKCGNGEEHGLEELGAQSKPGVCVEHSKEERGQNTQGLLGCIKGSLP